MKTKHKPLTEKDRWLADKDFVKVDDVLSTLEGLKEELNTNPQFSNQWEIFEMTSSNGLKPIVSKNVW